GAEKVFEKFGWIAHHEHGLGRINGATTHPAAGGSTAEKKTVRSPITTAFVLSCESMVLALTEVAAESLVSRALIRVVVALAITSGVYGVVALIVKMDDIGLHLAHRDVPGPQRIGRFLVAAMPKLLTLLSVVGTFAKLWVGRHILLVGTDELGLHARYGFRS